MLDFLTSQYPRKPTILAKMLDFLTSQDLQNPILSIILRSSKKQHPQCMPLWNTSKKVFSTWTANIAYVACQCLLSCKRAKICLSLTLNALRLTNAQPVKVKAKDDTPHISFHPRLLYRQRNKRPCTNAEGH